MTMASHKGEYVSRGVRSGQTVHADTMPERRRIPTVAQQQRTAAASVDHHAPRVMRLPCGCMDSPDAIAEKVADRRKAVEEWTELNSRSLCWSTAMSAVQIAYGSASPMTMSAAACDPIIVAVSENEGMVRRQVGRRSQPVEEDPAPCRPAGQAELTGPV